MSMTLAAVRVGLRAAGSVSSDLAARFAERLFTTPRHYDRPRREAEALVFARPFPLAVHGKPLTAWQWGQGPSVLLVHGWEGRGSQLGAFVDPLVERGFRVIAFDAPAHGGSPGKQAVITDFADAVAAADQAAGGLYGVIAHSFGGPATTLALWRGLRIPRAVFIGSPAHVAGALDRFTALTHGSPELRAALARRLEERIGLSADTLDMEVLAPALATELLVVHDRGDAEVPWQESREIAATWPHARELTTESLGHRRILWDPTVVTEAADFIAERGTFRRPGSPETPAPDARAGFQQLHIH